MHPEPNKTPFGTGLIIREKLPVNLESPFDQLQEFLTPNELFYIRSHFKAPTLKDSEHVLQVEGDLENPFSIGMDELRSMPRVTRPVTLECAGNGRVFLTPAEKGAQWELGAIGTAEWTGVPLSLLLQRARLNENVCELIFEGSDHGEAKEPPKPPGEIIYARSIPVSLKDEILIAYLMNGETLPPDHGFPLRAVVPGHYGMASVKWLKTIRAVSEPFQGYWQTADYAFWEYVNGLPVRRPLGKMALKSSIARPRVREIIKGGEMYTVFGAVWSGGPEITQVDVTTDGGTSWTKADLIDPARPGMWQRWKFDWKVPAQPGSCQLMSRARDEAGGAQPDEHEKRFGPYVICHTVPIDVTIR